MFCVTCGKEFLRGGNKINCSLECSIQYQKTLYESRLKGRSKMPTHAMFACLYCGDPFLDRKHKVLHFCCAWCRNEHRKKTKITAREYGRCKNLSLDLSPLKPEEKETILERLASKFGLHFDVDCEFQRAAQLRGRGSSFLRMQTHIGEGLPAALFSLNKKRKS